MQLFHCDHCGHLVFFENSLCLNCEHELAYLPDLAVLGSLEPAEEGLWRSPLERARGRLYRLCANYHGVNVCNWALPQHDTNTLCISCRLTRVIPDLSKPGHREAWYRLEVAKRRLIYSLSQLKLPITGKAADPERGLAFELLADPEQPGQPRVLTGHSNGVIVINVAEADDAQREARRQQLHEPYRTLLGHFRHEIGHYYWDRLIAGTDDLAAFRELFGDEQQDYAQSLQRHYEAGPPADWQQNHVSAYASTHPWEDWAESWAHYLHMTDTLETAAAFGMRLAPRRRGDPALRADVHLQGSASFERMIEDWYPLTYALNSLNRGLGLPDSYPFVLSTKVIEKLRFIHATIEAHAARAHDGSPSMQRYGEPLR
jgi:hypothetical protein